MLFYPQLGTSPCFQSHLQSILSLTDDNKAFKSKCYSPIFENHTFDHVSFCNTSLCLTLGMKASPKAVYLLWVMVLKCGLGIQVSSLQISLPENLVFHVIKDVALLSACNIYIRYLIHSSIYHDFFEITGAL
jgi:hypothetical protein